MSALEQKLELIQGEIGNFISRNTTKSQELDARMLQLEQFVAAKGGPVGGDSMNKSLGETLVESPGFKSLQSGAKESGKIRVGTFHSTKAITSGTPPSALIAPTFLTQPIGPGQRILTVRDLLSAYRTSSNLVQYTLESSYTNAAAPQGGENVAKAESNLVFSLQNAPVQTIATWIAASRQVLDDAAALQDYINGRLTYFVKLQEETQLLTGDGTGFNLLGLIPSATAYNRGVAAGDTDMDVIRKGLTQVRDSFFEPDGVILHPHDFERVQLTKTTTNEYVWSADPRLSPAPQVWGKPIVQTPAIGVGKFLVGAFKMAASIWDRSDATIEVSREHQDFFVKNMVAILCEERLALTVYRPTALVYGQLPQTGS